MHREQLPITALPAWAKLNDVNFLDISVADLGGSKGFGLVTERTLSSKDTFDIPTLLTIPHDLILSAESVEEHAKVDQHFRQLLDVAGGKSTRGDILLFLLMQITITSPKTQGHGIGLSNPWTEYVKILPSTVPVPTMWSEEDIAMLTGTSLETAVSAKMASLQREFENLRESTETISWCQKCWWDDEILSIRDWVLVDAWYRSRCLELPNILECMIPCIDMVNHASQPNAYYEHTPDNGVALLLRPDQEVDLGLEVTISYGNKSAAEMLFSYGFIDENSTVQGLVLPLEPFPDDPLRKAKVAAFPGPPVIRISAAQEKVQWESPFLYLMCLNEEDGLEFRVLQQTDGTQSQLRVFWQGSDVTDVTNTFESFVNDHPLKDLFNLRVLAILQDRIRQQLESLYESEEEVQSLMEPAISGSELKRNALQLRKSEMEMLDEAFTAIDMKKSALLESEVVIQYLGSMEGPERHEEAEEANDDEDFS